MQQIMVALRKESVDRNNAPATSTEIGAVALRKESVDRNMGERSQLYQTVMSLSARRAWIEIPDPCGPQNTRMVALRKESVDRNILGFGFTFCQVWSLSARRAWIEMYVI